MILTKYIPLHAYEIFNGEIESSNLILSAAGDWESAAKQWHIAGPAYTIMNEDKPVACGGVALLDPTYGECWLLLPNRDNGVVVFRYVLKMLQKLIDEHKFRRLQSHVIKGFKEGEKLMKRLGFEHEGWLRKYGMNGETYGIYARIF